MEIFSWERGKVSRFIGYIKDVVANEEVM